MTALDAPLHIVLEARFGVISKTFSDILFVPLCSLDSLLLQLMLCLPRLQRPPPTFKLLSLLYELLPSTV